MEFVAQLEWFAGQGSGFGDRLFQPVFGSTLLKRFPMLFDFHECHFFRIFICMFDVMEVSDWVMLCNFTLTPSGVEFLSHDCPNWVDFLSL